MAVSHEEIEQACFMLIACSGAAKSDYLEALELAKRGDYQQAQVMMTSGDDNYREAHEAHFGLIQEELSIEGGLLTRLTLVHAEDQLALAENTRMLVTQLIELYQLVNK